MPNECKQHDLRMIVTSLITLKLKHTCFLKNQRKQQCQFLQQCTILTVNLHNNFFTFHVQIKHYSVGQNVIIQAIHVNYTSWYGKLSENYAESKK